MDTEQVTKDTDSSPVNHSRKDSKVNNNLYLTVLRHSLGYSPSKVFLPYFMTAPQRTEDRVGRSRPY